MGEKSKKLAEAIGIRNIRGGKGVVKAYNKEQSHAHDLFVVQSKSQTEVANILGKSQSTISKWVNTFNWNAEREARHLSPMSIHTTIMNNNAELVKQLGNLDWETDPDGAKKTYVKLMDALSKGQSVANSIMKQYDSLAGLLMAMEDFINWLANNETVKKNHPDLLQQLELYLPAFSRAMAEKYG